MQVTEYDKTGRVFSTYGFPDAETFELNKQAGFEYVLGEIDGSTHYILNGQPTERPASPVTLSDLTLQGVPTGSTLFINGERYEGVEGDVELEFPLSGSYDLRVECFPYLDFIDTIVV